MVKCKICLNELDVDYSSLIGSDFPKYRAKCKSCGNIEYIPVSGDSSTRLKFREYSDSRRRDD